MSLVLRCVVWTLFALNLCACEGFEVNTSADALPSAKVMLADLVLQPGDRVRVAVFGEDRMSGEYDVDATGSIELPLGGSFVAAGLSLRGLETKISSLLKKSYLRDPKVAASIVSLRPFYVLGEVEKPGEYPFRTGLNVLRALAVAGGPTYRASASTILIQHQGEPQLQEYDLASDLTIQPGDLIRVPERWF